MALVQEERQLTATLFPPTMPPNASPFAAFQFDIIYADPPWSYNDKSSHRGGAARHYSTQSIEWIASLLVSQIAADDAVLFLWATWPTLPDAIAVIEAWGFTYKTCAFNWVKRNRNNQGWHVGMGAYTRANSEPCLLATRGNILERRSRSVRQIVEAPIEEHSRKPPEVRDRIVELFGDRPRIELFARERSPGWEAWGNKIKGDR